MLTFEKFSGINNVLPESRTSAADLTDAVNVHVGLTGELRTRRGYVEVSPRCHKNLWQARGFLLFTEGSHLTARHSDGSEVVLRTDIGPERVSYTDLPDGRVVLTNWVTASITDGTTCAPLAVPVPERLGAPDFTLGALHAGRYRYYLTYASGTLEGPAVASEPIDVAAGAGLRLAGLPQKDGYSINVYLSGKDGETAYLAGSTLGDSFTFVGANHELVLPCRTLDAAPMPTGQIVAFWRGRLLMAVGSVLYASRPMAPHQTGLTDFKPMTASITMVQPVDGGIFVGTEQDLIWLGGDTWDGLAYRATQRGAVVPGSGVAVPADQIGAEGMGHGAAMVCIAGGEVVAGAPDGTTISLTDGRYKSDAVEVAATFREVDGIPQYVAVAQ